MTTSELRRAAARRRGRLLVVFAITLAVLVLELVVGLLASSLALLADAAHMLVDGAAVGLVLLSAHLGTRPPSDRRTFGLLRAEVLATLVNGALLLAAGVYIAVEAVRRIGEGAEVQGVPMLVVAAIGLAANGVSLALLREGRAESMGVRSAYLEVLADLLGSAAVLVAATVVVLTGFDRADAIASLGVVVLVAPRAWRLLREAVDVLLQATPRGLDLDDLRRRIVREDGVRDVHDLHAWSLTTGVRVVSAHVVLEDEAPADAVLDRVCECLQDDFDIEHSTIQLESRDRTRLERARHD